MRRTVLCAASIALAAVAGIGGCFNPDYPRGQACTVWCPDPERCINGRCVAGNLVFATATPLPVGQLGGLAGADALCKARAESVRLPGTYVAWLSSPTENARDRLQSGRGWVRTDGKPFARSLDGLATGEIFYPPRLDERGNDVLLLGIPAVTGTNPDGTAMPDTCNGFTSTSGSVSYGFADGGTYAWSLAALNGRCDQPALIYCFGIDRDADIAPKPATGRRAFVTEQPLAMGTDGINGADKQCMQEAAAHGLTGSFQAVLATTLQGATSRFTLGTPWYRVDDVEVTRDFLTLTAPLDVTAGGERFSGRVWSGAQTPSQPSSATCLDWTNGTAATSTYVGEASRSGSDAFGHAGFDACDNAYRVYCLQM